MPERVARRIAGAAIVSLILASSLAAPGRAQNKVGTSLDPQNFGQIQRGRYLAIAGDCASCHTVPGAGQPFAGGRSIETPFGVVVGANITPDLETGIGAWSDEAFVRALREGKRNDGQLLYPAMPYPYYSKLTESDALAIRAYLNTVKPVRNPVVSNKLPFPFDVREGMTAWNAIYFRNGEFKPDPAKSAEWNRGAYLVESLGHCGACHTPKTTLGGDEGARAFQGYALQGWFAPNITNDNERGLGGWSIADIAAYLKNGHNPTSASTGIMGEEITLSSSQMTDADLTAIATYLKDLPGQVASPAPAVSASDPKMVAGGAIYADECSACHGLDGKGVPYLFPSLARSPNVRSADPTSLIRVLIEGARSVATAGEPTAPGMPSFAWKLSDDHVAAVLTYIRNSWGSSAPAVDPRQVEQVRARTAMASTGR
ncbi:MAG: c-type cytochrome [Hyphomicrobiales bacterium]|nr:c-type cytochrome [Hyphomicrobiales bacterium]